VDRSASAFARRDRCRRARRRGRRDGRVTTTRRTKAGLLKFRPVPSGGRVALVAPASPFDPAGFDAGLSELRRLGLEPVVDPRIFESGAIVAGAAAVRAASFMDAATGPDVDAVIAVRGGYGSVELLPWLDAGRLAASRTALVGYSDVTSLHAYLNGVVGLASVHGAMLEGRLAKGPTAYDPASLLASLSTTPLGELRPTGLETVLPGDVTGPVFGGTLTLLASSLGTPFGFAPPAGSVLFLEEVGERPYRIRRLLTQLGQAGRFVNALAVVVGQLRDCDEPGGAVTAMDVIREFFADFPGPVLAGFPSGHTSAPLVSFPQGVDVRVVGDSDRPALVFLEAAAG
jgi:muramoyltetrapeptide carboxypeptidase